MTALLELAERCEAATAEQQSWLLKDAGSAVFSFGSDAEQMRRFFRHIRNGAYVDAALTLVPDGWLVNEISQSIGGREWSCVLDVQPEPGTTRFSRACATAALAICAAALRARASDKERE